jgi:hypothetical protein
MKHHNIHSKILTGLLLGHNASGFMPSYRVPSKSTNGCGPSALHAIDFKRDVRSGVQSVLSEVKSSIPRGSNSTDSIIESFAHQQSRSSFDRSILASQSEQAEIIVDYDAIETINDGGWSYTKFAKTYPNANNLAIASVKTACADLVAQVAVSHTPIAGIDWTRTFLFFSFGFFYMGAFQYWYQVNIFKKFFDVDKFTSQSWGDKLKDKDGLISLAQQTVVDMTVSTLIYLPTFYVFKQSIFSGTTDPSIWLSQGLENYSANFAKDELDLIRIWGPADFVCFSVPLYLRLPARHAVSFVYIAYFSFLRAG